MKELGLEEAVVIAERTRSSKPVVELFPKLSPELVGSLRATSLAAWKRQSTAQLEQTALLLPLNENHPQSLATAEAVLQRLQGFKRPPQVYLHFRNTLSVHTWLRRLSGREEAIGLSESEVGAWLNARGWSIVERRSIAEDGAESGLAPATSHELVRLFRELNPSADAGYWLWRVEPGIESKIDASPTKKVSGRLSIVLDLRTADRSLPELDRTLFSLSCQAYVPVEWVLAGGGGDAATRAILQRHRRLGSAKIHRADDLNAAVEAASGQYLAFATPGLVIYPEHYRRQISRIEASDRAWSYAPARQVDLALDDGAVLHVATKRTVPSDERMEPLAFAREQIALYAAVIDRYRLGAFDLRFAAGESSTPFLWRLTALFEPLFTPGLPELELRGDQPIDHRGPEGLTVLRSIESWSTSLELAREQVRGSGIRRQFVDQINEGLKRRMPWLHQRMKQLVQGWISPVPPSSEGRRGSQNGW